MQKKTIVYMTTFIFIIISVLTQLKSVQAQEVSKTPWQMFRGNLQHTGQSAYKGAQTNTLKWSFKIDTRITSSPSIASDGTIYFGSIDGRLYAVNPDGTAKWAFQVGNEITASPAIGNDGTIYIGSRDKKMYAITSEGKLKWTYQVGGIILSSAAVTDNSLYFGSDDNTLYAITTDGKLNWKYTANSNITASPALGTDGTVYLFEVSGALHALSPDGTEKWVKRVGTGVYDSYSSPSIGSDGTVYLGTDSGRLVAVKPDGNVNGMSIRERPSIAPLLLLRMGQLSLAHIMALYTPSFQNVNSNGVLRPTIGWNLHLPLMWKEPFISVQVTGNFTPSMLMAP